FRVAHTLKGASRVVKQSEISECAHGVEDLLAPYREGGIPVPKDAVDGVLKLLDSIAAKVSALQLPSAPAPSPSPGSPEKRPHTERFETVRLEIREVELLLEEISQASVQLGALRRETKGIENALRRAQGAGQRAEDAAACLDELRNALARTDRNVSAA